MEHYEWNFKVSTCCDVNQVKGCFECQPALLHCSSHCTYRLCSQSEKPLIDVARFHGLGNGNGYIHYQASADNDESSTKIASYI